MGEPQTVSFACMQWASAAPTSDLPPTNENVRHPEFHHFYRPKYLEIVTSAFGSSWGPGFSPQEEGHTSHK